MVTPKTKRAAASVVLVLCLCDTASAQQFGQWTWDGLFRVGQRAYQNFIDEEKVSSLDQRDLNLGINVNGFIFHPLIADFRAGVEGSITKNETTGVTDVTRWGFRGNLNLFPRGRYRANIFAARNLFDYSDITAQDPLRLRGIPDTSTTLGGRFRISKEGPLGGTLIGIERTSFNFLDPSARQGIDSRQFVTWSRPSQDSTRYFRVERRFRDVGTVDSQLENITASYNHRQKLADTWRWFLTGVAIRQTSTISTGSSTANTLQLRNQFFRPVRVDDLLELRYSGALSPSTGSIIQSHDVGVRYGWRPRAGVEIAPFTRYGVRLSPDFNLRSPTVGLNTTWTREDVWDVNVTGSLSYGWLQLSDSGNFRTDNAVGLAVYAVLGRGDDSTIRVDVEGDAARSQARLGDELIDGLPGFGLPVIRAGIEDYVRGRVTLRRGWRSMVFSGFADLSRRQPSPIPGIEGPTVDTATFTVQLISSRLNIMINLGDQTVQEPTIPDPQFVRFTSVSATATPFRLLRVFGSYRRDKRQRVVTPDIDGVRAEAGFTLRFGAFALETRVFAFGEQFTFETERLNRGITWSIRRGFYGWLPVVTRGPREGTVR